jgi:hypothetical protein
MGRYLLQTMLVRIRLSALKVICKAYVDIIVRHCRHMFDRRSCCGRQDAAIDLSIALVICCSYRPTCPVLFVQQELGMTPDEFKAFALDHGVTVSPDSQSILTRESNIK